MALSRIELALALPRWGLRFVAACASALESAIVLTEAQIRADLYGVPASQEDRGAKLWAQVQAGVMHDNTPFVAPAQQPERPTPVDEVRVQEPMGMTDLHYVQQMGEEYTGHAPTLQ